MSQIIKTTAWGISGTADEIAELLCGPRQHDEHCKGWRWHMYCRDDRNRMAAVNAEMRKMLAERRAHDERRAVLQAAE